MRIRDIHLCALALLERAMQKPEYAATLNARRFGCRKCHALLDLKHLGLTQQG